MHSIFDSYSLDTQYQEWPCAGEPIKLRHKVFQVEEPMDIQTRYHYLVERPDKGTQELYIRGTGVRASTIWHDRYMSQMHPRVIAQDRELPVDAVYEALAYCQEHWDVICHAKAQEQAWLQERQFFAEPV